MAMFIRVKRKKTTYFLHCEPTETILEIKQKVQALSDSPPDCQRLILLNSMQILDDHKTLADQKVAQAKAFGNAQKIGEDETLQGLQGFLLEDAKSLAEQQVENDAIVALCLKISDSRVHRIPTLMRSPSAPYLPSTAPTPTPELAEDLTLASDEVPPPSPPPEHRMSTEVRVPYRPRPDLEQDVEGGKGDKERSQVGSTRKDSQMKDSPKKEVTKETGKSEDKKGLPKKGMNKKGVKNTSKQGGKDSSKKGGKKAPKQGEKDFPKKGGKMTKQEILPKADVVELPRDTEIWEDITIDKLADYASLVDSD